MLIRWRPIALAGASLCILSLCILSHHPLSAQDDSGETTTIDILADAKKLYGPPPPMEDCSDEQEAAIVSGEIIVCRRKQDPREFLTTGRESAQDRYARETAFANDPQAPDVAGDGIFRGPASVSGLCLIPPCPKEAALFIDIEALPEAPPGSDADRIARGLPPIGNEGGTPPAAGPVAGPGAGELGLPNPLSESRPEPSQAESATPEGQP